MCAAKSSNGTYTVMPPVSEPGLVFSSVQAISCSSTESSAKQGVSLFRASLLGSDRSGGDVVAMVWSLLFFYRDVVIAYIISKSIFATRPFSVTEVEIILS